MRFLILIFLFTSCTAGIKITKNDYKHSSDSFHKVQAHKIIEHTEKYKPKEERIRKKEKKLNLRVVKYNSRKKVHHTKRLANSNTFNFH